MSAVIATPGRAAELAHAAPVEQLEAWLAAAAPGAQAIYASGPDLPREAPGVKLVARWIGEKKVHPLQQRDPRNPARWNFLIVKAGGSPRDSGRPLHAVDRTEMRAMLSLLRRYAARGKPCPSHREMAELLDLPDRHHARRLIERLVAEGKIRVASRGRNLPCVVTIISSGKRTAE